MDSNRFWRQLELCPPDKLQFPITVIGAGAIGSATVVTPWLSPFRFAITTLLSAPTPAFRRAVKRRLKRFVGHSLCGHAARLAQQ
jgi:hypothetical protein